MQEVTKICKLRKAKFCTLHNISVATNLLISLIVFFDFFPIPTVIIDFLLYA